MVSLLMMLFESLQIELHPDKIGTYPCRGQFHSFHIVIDSLENDRMQSLCVAEIVKTERGAYLLSDLACVSFKQAGKQRNSR